MGCPPVRGDNPRALASGLSYVQGTMSTGSFSTWTTSTPSSSVAVHPASLAKHPQNWTKDEVGAWLRWCSEEFCIDSVPPEKFDMNGKAICLLARSDFMERLPGNGDLLYNCLQTLISKSIGGGAIGEQRHPTASGIACSSVLYGDSRSSLPTDLLPTGLLLVSGANTASTHSSHSPTPGTHVPNKPYIPIQPRLVQSSLAVVKTVLSRSTPNLSPKVVERLSLEDVSMNGEMKSPSLSPGIPVLKTEQPTHMNHDDTADAVLSLRMHRSADCRLLWEFIHQLLLDTKYSKYVCWENKEDYVFRIANPTGLAELWGQQKNRTNMTYEKLSRALRYYYRMNIIRKVPGKRLTYKFLQPPSMIQKGQRGAKPHTKVHLPQTLPPVSNSEARIKYDDESDYDSVTSGLDSPERMENKSSSFDDNDSLQNEFERTNKTMTQHSSPYLASHPSMNFPIALPSFGQTSIFQETSLGLQNNSYQSWPVSAYFQHLDMPHDYDRLVDSKTNNIVRPMPSYPPISEIGPFQNCIKQDVNLVRAHSANSKDIGLIEKRDRVLRLPIDRFYRSQSCELPEKLNELMTSFPGTKGKQIACPRRDFQSEPEDLSLRKNAKVEPGFLEADYQGYQLDSRICNSVKSDDSDSCKNGDNS